MRRRFIIETTKFDHLFTTATPRIAAGTHQRDELPREGGRWPVSVVLRPALDSRVAHTLDAVTQEAADLAGPGHWQTGQLGSAHLTVRALEPRREQLAADDPVVARYHSALHRAAGRIQWPIGFEVTGLTLTAGTVMACAEPVDAAADTFSDHVTHELGPDAWYETERRDIWYLNLLHFTGDIAAPDVLIEWVGDRRATPLGLVQVDAPELVRSEYRPGPRPHMGPIVLGDTVRAL
ncbi:hypothetical protein [Kribbella sindirgiensis]|uniref:2'-5' RNA ligase family protein n=1 Tax=Kribbella sindirgiensis TaxID=1124744 RepID=A0A4R0IZX5_9ACTN|nr:hypothetical protein [Kribbella sindirgiensis]TCC37218.1 hypothetical protein E0H50_11205 [Kribbella sindirgiensis]